MPPRNGPPRVPGLGRYNDLKSGVVYDIYELPFSPIQSTCTIRSRVGLLAELSEQPGYGLLRSTSPEQQLHAAGLALAALQT